MKTIKCLLLFSCFSFSALAQFGLTPAQRDSLNRLTTNDHNNMLTQLGIDRSQLRRGPSGNPKDANAANSSEEKVNQYTLPDPLVLKNGKKSKERPRMDAKKTTRNRRRF